MRICIKSGTQTIRFSLPTCLVFSRAVAWFGAHYGLRYAGEFVKDLSPDQFDMLFAEFRRIKKKYSRWELVDVESSNGDLVKIEL